MSPVNPHLPRSNRDDEAPAPDSSRPTNPWCPPPVGEVSGSIEDEIFGHHDTIPAPAWFDEAPDSKRSPALPVG